MKLTDTSDKIAIKGAAVAIEDATVANSEGALAKAAGGEITVLSTVENAQRKDVGERGRRIFLATCA